MQHFSKKRQLHSCERQDFHFKCKCKYLILRISLWQKIVHHSEKKKSTEQHQDKLYLCFESNLQNTGRSHKILKSQQVNFSSTYRRYIYINIEQENGLEQYTKLELVRLSALCEQHRKGVLDYRAGKSYTEVTVAEPLFCTFPRYITLSSGGQSIY